LQVTFFIPSEPHLEELLSIDPDDDWQRMRRGQRWVLQTYLRLKRAGHAVHASSEVPERGILVYHARHLEELKAELKRRPLDPVLVSIRADKTEQSIADFELLQNGRFADGARRHLVYYWPQPGLIPRDPSRGARVERMGFKGFDVNLHPDLQTDAWFDWLAANGMEWAASSMPFAPSEQTGVVVDWHDYSDLDVVVAIREHAGENANTHKPATKLYNAWHAGVPAVLAPDYAFRELRESELDYIEAESPEEARAALLRLRGDPDLYRSMVEHGLKRAEAFAHDRLIERWAEVLFEVIPAQLAQPSHERMRRLPRGARRALRRAERAWSRRPER